MEDEEQPPKVLMKMAEAPINEQQHQQQREEDKYSVPPALVVSSEPPTATAPPEPDEELAALQAFAEAAQLAQEHACHYITKHAARINKRLCQLHSSAATAVDANTNQEHDSSITEEGPKKRRRRSEASSSSSSSSSMTQARLQEQDNDAGSSLERKELVQQALRSQRMIDLLETFQEVQSRLLREMKQMESGV
ncbi:hypothetical protein ACA910_008249 [Epithemia clementina (nom. ined.)]